MLLFLLISTFAIASARLQADSFWKEGRKEFLKNKEARPVTHRPRNIIIFIGDGMSIPTITAARVLRAQRQGVWRSGRCPLLSFEDCPFVGLLKTANVDRLTADSSSTASALFTGTKINSRTVAVDHRVKLNNCSSYSPDTNLPTIFSLARDAGMATGIVTTARLTHATPASTFAHAANRMWESDRERNWAVKTESERLRCPDIASQFLTKGLDIRVAMGGGRSRFLPAEIGGRRMDKRNLLNEWETLQKSQGRSAALVRDKAALLQTTNSTMRVDRLLGLFADEHLPFDDERPPHVPSLTEMVTAALRILEDGPGYLLLVEAGRIDHGHHKGTARRALEATLELDRAFAAARGMTRSDDTLMLTTADHSHVFSIGGYATRQVDLFGFPDGQRGMAKDKKAFTMLLYANGPGAPVNEVREDPREQDTARHDYLQQAAVPLSKETHGADDVALFATGPMAHLFGGVREQNFVAHAVMFALCLGENRQNEDCASMGPNSAVKQNHQELLVPLMFIVTRLLHA